MKVLEEYIIPFSGLPQRVHEFDFEVDNKFFECFENSEIVDGKVLVKAKLDRKSVLLIFDLTAKGSVVVPCDRCGDDFELSIEGAQRIIVKLGNEDEGNEDDDIVYLDTKEHEINIAQFIYEMISLSVPYQRVHPKGKCNKETLKQIKSLAVTEKNKPTDPRWDALKNLN